MAYLSIILHIISWTFKKRACEYYAGTKAVVLFNMCPMGRSQGTRTSPKPKTQKVFSKYLGTLNATKVSLRCSVSISFTGTV